MLSLKATLRPAQVHHQRMSQWPVYTEPKPNAIHTLVSLRYPFKSMGVWLCAKGATIRSKRSQSDLGMRTAWRNFTRTPTFRVSRITCQIKEVIQSRHGILFFLGCRATRRLIKRPEGNYQCWRGSSSGSLKHSRFQRKNKVRLLWGVWSYKRGINTASFSFRCLNFISGSVVPTCNIICSDLWFPKWTLDARQMPPVLSNFLLVAAMLKQYHWCDILTFFIFKRFCC